MAIDDSDPNRVYIQARPSDIANYLEGNFKPWDFELKLNEALEAASIAVTKGEPDQEVVIRIVRSV